MKKETKNAPLIKSALIIVDVQNDFCPGGSLAVENGDAVVPVINRISGNFPLIVATKDWHPRGHISFASSHPDRKQGEVMEIEGIEQVLWPDHCIPGTNGAEFHPHLDISPVHCIIHKGLRKDIDSYSAFFENDKKTPTGLEGSLNGLGIEHIFVAGLATDVCVFFTALDGVKTGFTVHLIEDAVRGVDYPPGNLDKALSEMKRQGVDFIPSSEIG